MRRQEQAIQRWNPRSSATPAQDHEHKHDFVSSAEVYTDPTITQAITASMNPRRIYFSFGVGVGVG
jgi:hypothetical protein